MNAAAPDLIGRKAYYNIRLNCAAGGLLLTKVRSLLNYRSPNELINELVIHPLRRLHCFLPVHLAVLAFLLRCSSSFSA